MVSFKTWFKSLRAYSFTMSALPPVIVLAIGVKTGVDINIFQAVLFFMAVLLIHSGTNVFNDYFDHKSGVDKDDSPGPSKVIQQSDAHEGFMLKSGIIYFSLALLIGIFLMYKNPSVIFPGIVGIITAFFYTNKIFSLKYKALGEIGVFALFGPLLFVSAAIVFGFENYFSAIFVSIGFGLYSAVVLFINNIRDIETDKEAGIKTLPMIIGKVLSKKMFIGLTFLSLFMINIYLVANSFTLIIWPFIAASVALFAFLALSAQKENIDSLPVKTAMLYTPLAVLFLINFF